VNQGQIEQYLSSLGMAKALVERTMSVIDGVEGLLAGSVEHIFVSDFRDEEGNRHYENMWLMTQEQVSEVNSYLTEQVTFDVVPVKFGLARIEISREHFDLTDTAAEEQARLTVNIHLATRGGSALTGTLKASAGNCVGLAAIARDYLMPLLSVG
jgi:hypothetical protein